MRRVLLGVILLAVALAAPAGAQLMMTGVGAGNQGSGVICGGFQGIGDVVSGASAYYGLRAYSAAKCGTSAVQLLRASDSTTMNIITLSNGNFDTSTATTFCNATTCTISILYDQTGNGHNMNTPSFVPANEPAFTFNCLNTNLPCITYNGTSHNITGSASVSSFPSTQGLFGERTGNTSDFTSAYGATSDTSPNDLGANIWTNAVNSVGCNGAGPTAGTTADNAFHSLICANDASTNANMVTDGTLNSHAQFGSISTGAGAFGGALPDSGTPVHFFAGKFTEGFSYTTQLTTTQMQNLCHNQSLYYGTPSC